LVRDQELAQDIYQNVWESLIRSRDRYQPSGSFQSYVGNLITWRARDYIAGRSRQPATPLPGDADEIFDMLPDGEPDQMAIVHSKDMVARFEHCLETLPERQRLAFLLREDMQLSWEKVAERIDAPLETARARHRTARNKLIHCMGDLCPIN
jgi:RNA polymerase sigma-70 factor (ECF subfamily)